MKEIKRAIKKLLKYTNVWNEIKIKEGIWNILTSEDDKAKILNKLERIRIFLEIIEKLEGENEKWKKK